MKSGSKTRRVGGEYDVKKKVSWLSTVRVFVICVMLIMNKNSRVMVYI